MKAARSWVDPFDGLSDEEFDAQVDLLGRVKRQAARAGVPYPDGRLRVTVARSPLIRTTTFLPPGDWYVVSTFSQFDGQAQQKVYLILRSETGTVYWSGALYNAPP